MRLANHWSCSSRMINLKSKIRLKIFFCRRKSVLFSTINLCGYHLLNTLLWQFHYRPIHFLSLSNCCDWLVAYHTSSNEKCAFRSDFWSNRTEQKSPGIHSDTAGLRIYIVPLRPLRGIMRHLANLDRTLKFTDRCHFMPKSKSKSEDTPSQTFNQDD